MATLKVCEPDVDAFVDLSWALHAQDPQWIPPMRARLRQELTGQDAFGRYGRLQLFGSESGGRLVGRVAAIINPGLRDASGHPVGQFGYFEAIDDTAVATSLFDAAAEWLRSNGAREVWGPMNGGAHRQHRLMTAGFDRAPFLFEPRNPSYYPRLFEAGGFAPVFTWYSAEASSDSFCSAIASRPMLRIRPAVTRRFVIERLTPSDASVLPRLHGLLDAMWTGHVGYTPLTFAEFAELFVPALALMTAGDLHIAVERETGRDVGCAFSFPDYAAEVRALNGDATAWGHWLQTGTPPRRLVLHTFGIAADVRLTGLASALLRASLEHCVEKYGEGVMALTTQDIGALQKLGAVTRRYALFARRIAD